MREWNPVEVLRQSRHDWLNKLQLIKGYMALGNREKVEEVINEIIQEAEQETKLSNLPMSKFVSMILTYNWEGHPLHLHYEVKGKHNWFLNGFDDTEVSRWFDELLNVMNEQVLLDEENDLFIKVDLEEDVPRFFVEFYGILANTEAVEMFLHKKTTSFFIREVLVRKESISFIMDLREES